MTTRFDSAWEGARSVALQVSRDGYDVVVVRDLMGRISLMVDDRPTGLSPDAPTGWDTRMKEAAGRFCSESPVLLASQLFQPDEILTDPDLIEFGGPEEGTGRCRFLERGVVGGDWGRVDTHPAGRRVVLYGFKGGVGRTSATFLLAKQLAEQGRCTLVVDLDLESPGIGPMLCSESEQPEFGLVDHLVEAAVGNEDDLDLVTRSKRIRPPGNGEVWVAPARGRPRGGYHYLPKLNRVYADIPAPEGAGRTTFAKRLELAVHAAEESVTLRSRAPDVVLLDSRAGIHDVAAVALTQLGDQCLLFAADNAQTWTGYRDLFTHWRMIGAGPVIRERLRMVASMVPARSPTEYLAGFQDRSQACFAETLYDNADAGDMDAYNPAPEDEEAPHSPLPILFTGELIGLDASRQSDWHESEFVRTAFREFLEKAAALALGDDDGTP